MKALTLVAFTVADAAPASAQFGPTTGNQTKFQYISQSLEQLLNDGYEIRAADQGQLVLGKLGAASHKTSWVACSLNVTMGNMEKPTGLKTTTSTCFALN